jgi:hypothetical protein
LSELVRESFRQYQDSRRRLTRDDLALVLRIIAEAKAEPLAPADLRAESERLQAYGSRQAKKGGIKEASIPRVVHASRARRRPA